MLTMKVHTLRSRLRNSVPAAPEEAISGAMDKPMGPLGPPTVDSEMYGVNPSELDQDQFALYELLKSFDMISLFPYFNGRLTFRMSSKEGTLFSLIPLSLYLQMNRYL